MAVDLGNLLLCIFLAGYFRGRSAYQRWTARQEYFFSFSLSDTIFFFEGLGTGALERYYVWEKTKLCDGYPSFFLSFFCLLDDLFFRQIWEEGSILSLQLIVVGCIWMDAILLC